jgi:hypothetical protein
MAVCKIGRKTCVFGERKTLSHSASDQQIMSQRARKAEVSSVQINGSSCHEAQLTSLKYGQFRKLL